MTIYVFALTGGDCDFDGGVGMHAAVKRCCVICKENAANI